MTQRIPADFSHDNVDIHKLAKPVLGYRPDTGKVFANMVLWHAGLPFNYTPKSRPQNTKNGHIVVGYSKDAFFSAWVGTAKRGAPKSLKEQAIDKKEQAIDKPGGIGSDMFPF